MTIPLDSFTKQPSEAFAHEVDFAIDLETGETLSSATVTAVDQAEADSTAEVIDSFAVASSAVKVEIQAGTDGDQHTVTIVATTSLAHVLEHDFIVHVVEQP